MKIAASLIALPAVFGLKTRKVATAVRKLQDQYDAAEEDEYEYLQNYEQVYMTCDKDMKVMNEQGEYEYGVVVTRFCPNGASCDSDGRKKCDAGYGDYVVGIQTYMEKFLEQFDQGDDNQQDGYDNQFNFGDFGECREFEVEQQDNGDQGEYDDQAEQVQYFIGPTCDEGDIRIAMFTDEDCIYESLDVSFEDLTGVALPWSTSILEDEDCKPYYCYGMNENAEYEYNAFCTDVVQNANLKCETEMETFSSYGKTEGGCETISAMLPASTSSGAKIFLIVVLVLAVVGFAAWFFVQKKKKATVDSNGLMM